MYLSPTAALLFSTSVVLVSARPQDQSPIQLTQSISVAPAACEPPSEPSAAPAAPAAPASSPPSILPPPCMLNCLKQTLTSPQPPSFCSPPFVSALTSCVASSCPPEMSSMIQPHIPEFCASVLPHVAPSPPAAMSTPQIPMQMPTAAGPPAAPPAAASSPAAPPMADMLGAAAAAAGASGYAHSYPPQQQIPYTTAKQPRSYTYPPTAAPYATAYNGTNVAYGKGTPAYTKPYPPVGTIGGPGRLTTAYPAVEGSDGSGSGGAGSGVYVGYPGGGAGSGNGGKNGGSFSQPDFTGAAGRSAGFSLGWTGALVVGIVGVILGL